MNHRRVPRDPPHSSCVRMSLLGVITIDDNSMAVVMLHNYDFNDHWWLQNAESWRDITDHVNESAIRPFDERTFLGHGSKHPLFSIWAYCPSYAANGGRSRQTFQGQARFRCVFADGTVTRALDHAPDEITCATSLRVWCPIPPSIRQVLARCPCAALAGPLVCVHDARRRQQLGCQQCVSPHAS